MPKELAQIFVSSTSDLQDERQAVKEVVRENDLDQHLFVFAYEDVPSQSGSPEKVLLKELFSTDILVLILGSRYGSLHPDNQRVSIVEWEYQQATKKGVFKKPSDAFIFIKKVPQGDIDESQEVFRDKLTTFTKHWSKHYETVDDFKKILLSGLINWLRGYDQDDRVSHSTRLLLALIGSILMAATVYFFNSTDFSEVILISGVAYLLLLITMIFQSYVGTNLNFLR